MKSADPTLWAFVEPVVLGLGHELVGVEFGPSPQGSTLRVYIDDPGGVTLDACADVSRQLSAVLDVKDPIVESYQLEVSSPGVDRPLFREADYRRFAGRRVRVRMSIPQDGRRSFAGTLLGVAEGQVSLDVGGEVFRLRIAEIGEARLVPDM
jgi:ribosome maturation factor RimP